MVKRLLEPPGHSQRIDVQAPEIWINSVWRKPHHRQCQLKGIPTGPWSAITAAPFWQINLLLSKKLSHFILFAGQLTESQQTELSRNHCIQNVYEVITFITYKSALFPSLSVGTLKRFTVFVYQQLQKKGQVSVLLKVNKPVQNKERCLKALCLFPEEIGCDSLDLLEL